MIHGLQRTEVGEAQEAFREGPGFDGWLEPVCHRGLADQHSVQVERLGGMRLVVYRTPHDALNLIYAAGCVLAQGTDSTGSAGDAAQGGDP